MGKYLPLEQQRKLYNAEKEKFEEKDGKTVKEALQRKNRRKRKRGNRPRRSGKTWVNSEGKVFHGGRLYWKKKEKRRKKPTAEKKNARSLDRGSFGRGKKVSLGKARRAIREE